MRKAQLLGELKTVIETQAYIHSINHKVQESLGYDLSTLYILSLLQESTVGIGVTELTKALLLSPSAMSIRLTTGVRQRLIHVEGDANDRRTKRVYITEYGAQVLAENYSSLKRILNTN
ncbi:hypothetical protein ACRYI5_00185 [Furfurilactobacillus sp. WILCCON 0119]